MYRVPGAGGLAGGAGLAATGAEFVWWLALGVVLLVAGFVIVRTAHAGRPRASGRHHAVQQRRIPPVCGTGRRRWS